MQHIKYIYIYIYIFIYLFIYLCDRWDYSSKPKPSWDIFLNSGAKHIILLQQQKKQTS